VAIWYYRLRILLSTLNIHDIVGCLNAMANVVFVNIEMVVGFSRKGSVFDFLKKESGR
jgi:glycerol-3-phosphate responsive antiterminator